MTDTPKHRSRKCPICMVKLEVIGTMKDENYDTLNTYHCTTCKMGGPYRRFKQLAMQKRSFPRGVLLDLPPLPMPNEPGGFPVGGTLSGKAMNDYQQSLDRAQRSVTRNDQPIAKIAQVQPRRFALPQTGSQPGPGVTAGWGSLARYVTSGEPTEQPVSKPARPINWAARFLREFYKICPESLIQ